jgi:hypothetical protein
MWLRRANTDCNSDRTCLVRDGTCWYAYPLTLVGEGEIVRGEAGEEMKPALPSSVFGRAG